MEKIGFVVKGKDGQYMGIDQSSGGYAYLTPYFSSARFFKTADEASSEANYWNKRPNYNVVECRVVPVFVGNGIMKDQSALVSELEVDFNRIGEELVSGPIHHSGECPISNGDVASVNCTCGLYELIAKVEESLMLLQKFR